MRRFLSAALVAFFCCASIAVAGTRVIVMPGENPRSIDQNGAARFERLDKGTWRKDALGTVCTTGAYANLSVVPNGGMYVAVQPTGANTEGSLYQMGADDVNPIPQGSWSSSLAADNTQICIHGMQAGPSGSIGPITAPGSGSNQYFLVEAQIQSVDNNSQSVRFINSNNSSSFQTVNTNRVDAIVYQLKAGVVNGSAPSPDSGWIGIANILVPGGASSITSGMITALSAFGGFIGNGTNVTLNGLTLSGASSGCLQTNSSGVVSVQTCTSGLGSVTANSPIAASTVGGVATISCTTCVTSVSAAGPLSSSGGTAPQISLSGTVPVANLPTTVAETNANNNFSVSQTLSAASVTGNTTTNSLNVSSYSVGNAAATPPPQTGNNGAYVVAQATAAPTIQPGNIGVQSATFSKTITAGQDGSKNGLFLSNGAGTSYSQFGAYGSATIVSGIGCTEWGEFGTTAAAFHLCMDGSGDLGIGGSMGIGGNAVNQFGYYLGIGNANSATTAILIGNPGGNSNSITSIFTSSTNAVQSVTANALGIGDETSPLMALNRSGNLGVSGTVTATNFFTGSRREWKKNIVPYTFDALSLLGQVDYKEYDCKTADCGPVGTHKAGIIANDSPVQVSGPKHDHYDAFAMAAIDGKAIVELNRRVEFMGCVIAALLVWCLGLTILVMRRA